MTKILVLFYSTYGHMYGMAKAAADGAKEAGAEVAIKRVAETLPADVLEKMGAVEAQKAFADVPIAEVADLPAYDGIILACPTRFGNMPAQMKTFWDATGQLWMQGSLTGKVGAAMTSTGSQHGGQETTLMSMHTMMLHHGMLIAGSPYSLAPGQMGVEEVKGGSPYGATTIAGGKGERLPSAVELETAKIQGKYVADTAKKLSA
eukprot:PhM_4_TR6766/c2_g1_i2/m.76481/K03809/wrbA; NAD(P)H dehydrogenase (quinone)